MDDAEQGAVDVFDEDALPSLADFGISNYTMDTLRKYDEDGTPR